MYGQGGLVNPVGLELLANRRPLPARTRTGELGYQKVNFSVIVLPLQGNADNELRSWEAPGTRFFASGTRFFASGTGLGWPGQAWPMWPHRDYSLVIVWPYRD